MTPRESVPLSTLTTLRIGGEARCVIDIDTQGALTEALLYAREHALPFSVLGEGSNVLASDRGYTGVVLCMRTQGITYAGQADGTVLVRAEAGVSWDALVREAATRGLWGIENLAGIPGTAGAAPVQNIGAYGSELADMLVDVEAYDTQKGMTFTIAKEECALGYRDSRFKREPHLIIMAVTLRLTSAGNAQLAYADLTRAREAGVPMETPTDVGEAVRTIRSKKFPDIRVEGTAGSFFKNPVITKAVFDALASRISEIPSYPAVDGVKVPLAYVLDKVLGLRGYRLGPVRLFEAQPLVLVADDGATAADVDRLADDVAKKVFDATNIVIEREVRSLE